MERGMRQGRQALGWAAALVPLVLAGCAQNGTMLGQQAQAFQQQQQALAQQAQELQSLANALDKDNQELEMLLAQERQRVGLYQDQLAALRDQLTSATTQISRLTEEGETTRQRADALAASTGRRAAATITANSSLAEELPIVDLPNVAVRRDGDVIRVELPAAQLFDAGAADLRPGAAAILESCAAELARTYPDHFVGIEGHTDTGAVPPGRFTDNHQLSAARAAAVYSHLAARSRLRAEQLFIAGHGPNHPVVSNATPAGRERNRRIELVVYPEQLGRR
jgi:chemotaxis protein MotB